MRLSTDIAWIAEYLQHFLFLFQSDFSENNVHGISFPGKSKELVKYKLHKAVEEQIDLNIHTHPFLMMENWVKHN